MFKAFFAFVALFFVANQASAQDYSFMYEQNVEAVVEIQTATIQGGMGLGTGWFIADRFIITAAHVLGEEPFKNYITVSGNDYPSKNTPAKVLFADPQTDVGILEITTDRWNNFKNLEKPTNLKFSSMDIIPGQEVWGIGNRNGFLFQFYSGHVSYPNFPDFETSMNVHIIESEIFQGDSGGPLFDKNGYVIGLARSILNPGQAFAPPPEPEKERGRKQEKTASGHAVETDNMEFYVSREVIRKSMKDFIDHKTPFHPNFEADVKLVVDELDGRIVIAEIKDYSVLYKNAGLRAGDRKLFVNGMSVKEPIDLARIFSMISYNDLVRFEWERKGEKMTGEMLYSR